MNKWGRPKKGEGEIKNYIFTLYPKDIENIRSLGKLWRLSARTDVLRKAVKTCLDIENKKSQNKSN